MRVMLQCFSDIHGDFEALLTRANEGSKSAQVDCFGTGKTLNFFTTSFLCNFKNLKYWSKLPFFIRKIFIKCDNLCFHLIPNAHAHPLKV